VDAAGGGNAGGAAATGGTTSSGGVVSTSTTVLRIISGTLRNVSLRSDPGGGHSNADAGVDAGSDDGLPLVLHGVNRSGTEYQCTKGIGIFDGPDTEESIQIIKSWNVNAVRIPLNETCWLTPADAPSLDTRYSGVAYKQAIERYVALLHKYDIYPILDLHWAAPKGKLALNLLPMPDADHAETFWKDVATTFKDDLGVIFELFNEPFPGDNQDTDAAWKCWRDGCSSNIWGQVTENGTTSWKITATYQSVGFQALVSAVREAEGVNTSAHHVILLGGVTYSNGLTQWSKYKPVDPANNLGAAWHTYNNNRCATTTCFDGSPLTLSKAEYVLVTEFGENDCASSIVTPWMNWWDAHGLGYLAWTWNVWGGACVAKSGQSDGNPWPLIRDFVTGTPMGDASSFASAVHDHYAMLAP
jgi:hypothetical protein